MKDLGCEIKNAGESSRVSQPKQKKMNKPTFLKIDTEISSSEGEATDMEIELAGEDDGEESEALSEVQKIIGNAKSEESDTSSPNKRKGIEF